MSVVHNNMRSALIFLISVLILGISSQTPFLITNGETDLIESDTHDMQILVSGIAFAESDEEEEDEIEEEEEEVEEEEETEDEEDEEIEIQVEVEDGHANVKIKINDEEQEFTLETDDEGEILSSIMEITGLTESEIKDIWEFETEEEEIEEAEEEETEEDEEDEEEETEIEVEVRNGKAKVRIEFNDQKSRFVLNTTNETEILSAIVGMINLTESEIKDIWEFETEEEEIEEEEEIMAQETEAEQRALELIDELIQKIEQLEDRIQSLLLKLETGEYFGPTLGGDPVTNSYNLSFDGSATSIDDSTVTDITGEIFFESLVSREDVSKLRITGGDIVVGDTIYDLVFGKARVTSSGPSGEQDSMIIIAHMLDGEGNSSNLKILLESVNLEAEFGSELAEVTIMTPQSKIAGQWLLSGSGQLSLT